MTWTRPRIFELGDRMIASSAGHTVRAASTTDSGFDSWKSSYAL